MCKAQSLCCLPSVLMLAYVPEGVVCQDYHGLIPERVCLCKIPIRRFSLCSGVLLLGALKRPTEPAKNQSATI